MDPASPCVQRLTPANLRLLDDLLTDEEAPTRREPGEDEAVHTVEAPLEATSQLFGTIQVPGAPAPDLTEPTRRISSRRVGRHRRRAIVHAVPTETIQRGFWKILSRHDVSRTSSPGQIQIPIRFRQFFPEQRLTRGPDSGGRGRQWEVSLSVRFKDGDTTIMAQDARFIVYEPRTGHPRPNTECRFTFRNVDASHRLEARDILLFHVAEGGEVVFEVERISRTDPRYRRLYRGGRERWGLTSQNSR